MNDPNAGIRNFSDTALWVAYIRAVETRRADAVFCDPYAERLAGARGLQIAQSLGREGTQEWGWVARTYQFDALLSRLLRDGTDLVLNLAAGLDSRPYRMDLPSTLQWIEVDFPEIISYKEKILATEKPRCRLERVALDLSDAPGRRALFQALNARAAKIAVLSEGLLIYMEPEHVAALARDLACGPHFQNWIVDLCSTIQLIVMQRTFDRQLSAANLAFKFGPPEGVDFFRPHGWEPKEVHGLLQTAADMNRAPEQFLSLLPDPNPIPPNFPWSGVCLLRKPE